MALMEMEQIKDAALKYDKPTLARLAQSGQLSPTTAIMAGMMRDRIVQSEMKPPAPPTVAEEVMQPMGQRMGLGAIAPGGQPQAPQQMPPQMPQGQGLDQVPIPPQMFDEQRMASGGIVAFQAGGGTPHRMFEQQGMANGGIVAFQDGGQPPSFSQMYAGLTPDLTALAAARKAYMGDFPMESPEERLRRRKEEQALRLMEAGLGIAGGTSPYFAANLKGALPGIQGYGADLATQRKEDLARLAAERGEKGKVFEGVMGSREKAEQRKSAEGIARAQRESAETIAELQASKASNMKQFAMDEIAAQEALKGRPLTEAEKATIRSNANKEYVRLTAALDPRTMSARASESRSETAAEGKALGAYNESRALVERMLGPLGTDKALRKEYRDIKDPVKREAFVDKLVQKEMARAKAATEAFTTKGQPGAAPVGAQGTSSPPSAAVSMLKANPSNTAKQQFDEIFGPGAAARALANK